LNVVPIPGTLFAFRLPPIIPTSALETPSPNPTSIALSERSFELVVYINNFLISELLRLLPLSIILISKLIKYANCVYYDFYESEIIWFC